MCLYLEPGGGAVGALRYKSHGQGFLKVHSALQWGVTRRDKQAEGQSSILKGQSKEILFHVLNPSEPLTKRAKKLLTLGSISQN